MRFAAFVTVAVVATLGCSPPPPRGARPPGDDTVFDVVVAGGTVVDPETSLFAPRDVGIVGGTIRRVSAQPLRGRRTIDARGRIVAPGFIDLHEHAQNPRAYRVEVRDGVTSSLELEQGTGDIDRWYAERAGRTPINYGVSAGHVYARMQVMHDVEPDEPTGDAAKRPATDAEIDEIARHVELGLQRGAVAVGVLLAYTPAATPWEVLKMFSVAAKHHASVHIHVRNVADELDFIETEEAIGAAAITGASVQIVHVQSTGLYDTPRLLELIASARRHGIDVTTECYPYTTSMTSIRTAPNWRDWPDARFAKLEWPATGERLTRESFEKYFAMGGNVVIHNNTEEVVRGALANPLTMIASDGILSEAGIGHPRVAGTYSRVLGVYVREQHVLTLAEAIKKMTLMPAQRLERRVPGMRRKGRVQEGADADLVVFDPRLIRDHATYRQPDLPSTGISDVLVRGVSVVQNGELVAGAFPGEPVRAPIE
ncbi:MAG TPA: amidohydrolase family protein [Minicystis sp.]|nr:amidohydrolase family protein [Minicystis sp.]